MSNDYSIAKGLASFVVQCHLLQARYKPYIILYTVVIMALTEFSIKNPKPKEKAYHIQMATLYCRFLLLVENYSVYDITIKAKGKLPAPYSMKKAIHQML